MDIINIPNVTIININCIDSITAVKSLNFSTKLINFNSCILFSDEKPTNITNNIKFQKIDKISSVKDYNKFVLKELVNYIDTDYCLVIQNDGFVINPHKWSDDFLNYDYIGAPWDLNGMRVWKRTNRIGNGGFSLRSKKLMKFIQELDGIDYNQAEDVTVSLIIDKYNFLYPSVKDAVNFSLEVPLEDYPFDVRNCFGFHGNIIYNNLLTLCPNVLNIKNL